MAASSGAVASAAAFDEARNERGHQMQSGKSPCSDSNRGPIAYKAIALPTELHGRDMTKNRKNPAQRPAVDHCRRTNEHFRAKQPVFRHPQRSRRATEGIHGSETPARRDLEAVQCAQVSGSVAITSDAARTRQRAVQAVNARFEIAHRSLQITDVIACNRDAQSVGGLL